MGGCSGSRWHWEKEVTVRIPWHLGACIGRHKKVLGVLKTLWYSHSEKCNPGLLVF